MEDVREVWNEWYCIAVLNASGCLSDWERELAIGANLKAYNNMDDVLYLLHDQTLY